MDTKKKFDVFQEEIQKKNRESFENLSLGGVAVCAAITLIGLCLIKYTDFFLEYSLFLLYLILMFALAKYCQKRQVKHIVLIFYCAVTPIMIGGILMGTFFDPTQPAITIMVLINVMLLFIIDKPIRLLCYLLSTYVVFAVCCFIAKDKSMFMADLIDLLIYGSIAIGINYAILKSHLENVENFCMVEFESHRDSLTRLYNRGYGELKTRKAIEKKTTGSLLILDIDDFKRVNDTYGHKVGDEIICGVSQILRQVFRAGDIIFRLGGDEYAVFAPFLTDENSCKERFEEIRKRAQNMETSNPDCSSVGLSGGWTIYSGTEVDFETVYNSSDSGLYEAKASGKNTYVIKNL